MDYQEYKHDFLESLRNDSAISGAETEEEFLNRTLEILVDEFNLEQQIYIGRDEGGKVVHFNSDKNVVGEFVSIKITKASGISLYGEIV